MNEWTQQRVADNQKLIGKTVYWMDLSKEECIGVVESVKDYESVMVKDSSGGLHNVCLFDIFKTI